MTDDMDRSDELWDWYAEDDPAGAAVLDRTALWYRWFIRVTDPDDLNTVNRPLFRWDACKAMSAAQSPWNLIAEVRRSIRKSRTWSGSVVNYTARPVL